MKMMLGAGFNSRGIVSCSESQTSVPITKYPRINTTKINQMKIRRNIAELLLAYGNRKETLATLSTDNSTFKELGLAFIYNVYPSFIFYVL